MSNASFQFMHIDAFAKVRTRARYRDGKSMSKRHRRSAKDILDEASTGRSAGITTTSKMLSKCIDVGCELTIEKPRLGRGSKRSKMVRDGLRLWSHLF
jgi:hypothetical protein